MALGVRGSRDRRISQKVSTKLTHCAKNATGHTAATTTLAPKRRIVHGNGCIKKLCDKDMFKVTAFEFSRDRAQRHRQREAREWDESEAGPEPEKLIFKVVGVNQIEKRLV